MWDFSWIYVSCKLSVIHGHILVRLPVGEGAMEQPFLLVWTVFSDASYEWCQLLLVSQEFLHDFSRVQRHKQLGSYWTCTKRICSWVSIDILDRHWIDISIDISINVWINTWLTLDWHLIDISINTWSTLHLQLVNGWPTVDRLICINNTQHSMACLGKLGDSLLTFNGNVDWVLTIKMSMEWWLDVDGVSIKILIEGIDHRYCTFSTYNLASLNPYGRVQCTNC